MTKQLSDLFQQFSAMETSKQLEKIREIRHHRSIERPAAAVKRVKKEKKQVEKKKSNIADILKKLPPEQRAAIISKIQADLNAKKADQASSGTSRADEQQTRAIDSGDVGGTTSVNDGSSGSRSDSSSNS